MINLMFEIGSIAGYVALFFSKDKMKFKKTDKNTIIEL